MKKTLLTTLVFVFGLTAVQLNAQDEEKNNGIRAGWSSSNIHVEGEKFEDAALSGFYVGFFRDNKIGGGLLSLNTGLEYVQNGFNVEDLASMKIHYLSVPIGLRVKIGPVYGTGGAAANFKVGQKATALGQDIDLTDDEKPNFFDVPLFLGVGFKIAIVSIDLKYNWGMLDLYGDDGDISSRNQYLQIGASLYL